MTPLIADIKENSVQIKYNLPTCHSIKDKF